jgi:hypothetical protein
MKVGVTDKIIISGLLLISVVGLIILVIII